MTAHILKNEEIEIEVQERGAELTRLTDVRMGREYLWNADPKFWNRTSPILFPFVGGLKNKQYQYEGNTYSMPQHGFARDMVFQAVEQNNDSILLRLKANEDTKINYPFEFVLEILYRLKGRELTVEWKVWNYDTKIMYFSIGGHPAFLCPLEPEEQQTDCQIGFDTEEELKVTRINENGLAAEGYYTISTEKGRIPVTGHLFDQDALVIENDQAHKVFLAGKDGEPYVTVAFDAPLFGVWSPAGKQAPFICIEPWYGRCDAQSFEGGLSDREWIRELEPMELFSRFYTITV